VPTSRWREPERHTATRAHSSCIQEGPCHRATTRLPHRAPPAGQCRFCSARARGPFLVAQLVREGRGGRREAGAILRALPWASSRGHLMYHKSQDLAAPQHTAVKT
jgi:hypothetical protein